VILADLVSREPTVSLPRTVAEVLSKHVTLELEGIDRMYVNVFVPSDAGIPRRGSPSPHAIQPTLYQEKFA
jgi:hypothetical protein